ncbi:MAG: polymerase, sigma-24 subunit, subfamily [Frankiales bacterium]|nr:polymerase, sigma-24 subunit, subfamily [Frankiales bacterium]
MDPVGSRANRDGPRHVLDRGGGGPVEQAHDEAFTAFVGARSRHLLQAAHLLTGDRHRAEDLLQTALTRAYLRWDRIVDEDPEGYVRRTMVNAHIDWWRRKPWREQTTDDLPDVAVPDGTGTHAARAGLLVALAELSPRQRAVMVLRYFEDMSEAEIARTLGCSTGTVKSAASRAAAKLRVSLTVEEAAWT